MTRRFLLALALAIGPTLVDAARTPVQSAGTACANLAALTMPGISVRSATPVAAGAFTPPGARLAAIFTAPLGDREETAQGVWVRQLTVENPR